MSHAVHLAAGGQDNPLLARESLRLPQRRQLSLELNIVATAVEVFCLGETAAVRLFSQLRSGCDQPDARATLDRVLIDEVRHRDYGWTLMEWFWSMPFREETAAYIRRELPAMFRRLQLNYSYGSLADETPRTAADAHWAMMPAGYYARALHETFQRDYAPLFAQFDIDAGPAWHACP